MPEAAEGKGANVQSPKKIQLFFKSDHTFHK
jgi:hypothetical protein